MTAGSQHRHARPAAGRERDETTGGGDLRHTRAPGLGEGDVIALGLPPYFLCFLCFLDLPEPTVSLIGTFVGLEPAFWELTMTCAL